MANMTVAADAARQHVNSGLLKPNAYSTGPYGGAGSIAAPALPWSQKQVADVRRRRMNIVPIVLSLLAPWFMFCVIFGVTSFSWQYDRPALCYFVVVLGLVAVCVLALFAIDATKKKHQGQHHLRAPSWMIFVFLTCTLMWLAGLIAGDLNYVMNMRPFYDLEALNTYLSVDPAGMRGEQLMDGGRVVFSGSSRLDFAKAMGFRSTDVYCVAPITSIAASNGTKLTTYDFWAVGKNCCLGPDEAFSVGGDAGFHCGDFKDPKAHGGIRLMTDEDRPFYRLAVQQAEAAHGIKASHPLFYTWMVDPIAHVNDLSADGERFFLFGIFTAFVVQLFLVLSTTVSFSRLGSM